MNTTYEALRAGTGKALLTPPVGTELAGYGYYLDRRARDIHDDLYARALAIEQGGRRYCVVSCDLLGLSADVAASVREDLESRHGCPPGHAMLVSIHTHTGPTVKHHEGTGEVTPAYVETVAPAIGRACDAAFATLSPVTGMSITMGEALPRLCYNRTGEGLPLDNQVRALRLDREGGRPIALLSHACHAVARGRISAVSADYPGQVCESLAANDIEGIYVNGACGDIDPLPPHRDGLAERLAQAVVSALALPSQPLPLTVSGGMIAQTLRVKTVTEAMIRQAADGAQQGGDIPGGGRVARVWEAAMLTRRHSLSPREYFIARWLRLGGVPIVALPFETFTRTAELIREAAEDPRALVLGCADEMLGYLPTREDIGKASYAALESTFLYKRLPPLAGEAERLGTSIGQALFALGCLE